MNQKFKVIYVCDEDFVLPLKDGCIDLFLDDFSSSEYIFYGSCYPFEKVKSLLNKNAFLGGIYTYYQNGAKTLAQIEQAFPNAKMKLFTVETLKSRLRENGVAIGYEQNLGYVENPGTGFSFPYHNPVDKLYFYMYFGTKQE
ncbi:hypothetical protein LJC49_05310 [Ruminococcaceae bacterium OttesenSCG-928-I18]|nr:hypothetical protein [Ruminococcaceae bacterium OttesenSCG-928-I18]